MPPEYRKSVVRLPTVNERGILFVIAATASFTTCDTLIKLATADLPIIETMFLRSFFAVFWAIPFLVFTGDLGRMRGMLQKRVVLRSVLETISALSFLVGLANVPIAEVTALIQLSPIMLMLAAGLFLGLRVTGTQFGLAFLAFVGALLVVQPGGSGFSAFVLFGLLAAAFSAGRELVGRTVPVEISGPVVAMMAMLVSAVATGAAMLVFEDIRMPNLTETALIAASAFFMVCAQIFVFSAYRQADPGVVAPFFYSGALWAVISSGLVFSVIPNGLALGGIALIIGSGVGVLLISRRRKDVPVVEADRF